MIFRSALLNISPRAEGETRSIFESSCRPLCLGYSKKPAAKAYSIMRRWRGVSFSPSEILATRTMSATIPWLFNLLKSLRNELFAVMARTQSTVPSCLLGDARGHVKQKQFTSAIVLHMVESAVETTPRILPRFVFTICASRTFSSFWMNSTIC